MPLMTRATFQPRLYESCIETFMPWPALGEWVWTASPARKMRSEDENLLPTRWPIW